MFNTMYKILFLLLSTVTFAKKNITATKLPEVENFIIYMVDKYKFDKNKLTTIFDNINLTIYEKSDKRPKKIRKKISWQQYKKIFLTDYRIKNGAIFMQKNLNILQRAEDKFNIDKAIIVAILGIETNYGLKTGNYPTLSTLTKLAFGNNRRKKFYKKELEHFFLLTKNNVLDRLNVAGSYAGAIGYAQFIPSSYRYYAVDFDNNNKIDLFNVTDAIGSIANYLSKHKWQKNGKIVIKTTKENLKFAKSSINKPKKIAKYFRNKNVKIDKSIKDKTKLAFIKLGIKNKEQVWLSFWNFYVITRYNHNNMYAMTVVKLAKKIKQQYENL